MIGAALVLLVLVAAAAAWVGREAGRTGVYGRTRIERLAGGQVRATATGDDGEVTITGPGSLRVGQRAAYTASTSSVVRHEWLAPDGRAYESEPVLTVVPSTDGITHIRLLGQTADGDVVVADLRVTVEAAA